MDSSIPAAEFKRRFSDFIGRIVYKHERFVITRRGKPVAEITPIRGRPNHIGEVKGWLEDDDPFLKTVESIVADRSKHIPRVSSVRKK